MFQSGKERPARGLRGLTTMRTRMLPGPASFAWFNLNHLMLKKKLHFLHLIPKEEKETALGGGSRKQEEERMGSGPKLPGFRSGPTPWS